MFDMEGDIKNRPRELWDFPNYACLPDQSFEIDLESAVGKFLAQDIFDLDGNQPIESKILGLSKKFFDGHPVIEVNPSDEAIDFYRARGDIFQMINVVVCCHSFMERHGKLYGLPYHISLRPAQKSGKPSSVGVDWVKNIDLSRLLEGKPHYMGYNPFSDAYGLYVVGPAAINKGICSDAIGWVYNTYLLASRYDKKDICDPGLCTSLIGKSRALLGDYRKFRVSNYFRAFKETKPIKIWGCDSPIELFLLQAMSQLGLNPKIQTLILPDGSTFPSLQSMWEGGLRTKKLANIITEADFFFEDEKIAVFCDSVAHHTSDDAIAKDTAIDQKLARLGICSIRISGTEIMSSPTECAKRVQELVSKTV